MNLLLHRHFVPALFAKNGKIVKQQLTNVMTEEAPSAVMDGSGSAAASGRQRPLSELSRREIASQILRT